MPDPFDLKPHEPALLRFVADRSPAWLRRVLSPGDLVNQTFLEVLRSPARVAELGAGQQFAYLQRAVENNLKDAIRKHERERTDVPLGVLAESSRRLGEWAAAGHTSPSERAARAEGFARLAAAISALPDAQRVAVEMRYLSQRPVADIARELERSVGAVSLLLSRALVTLRSVLAEPND